LKQTIVTGLLVLLPVIVVVKALTELVRVARKIAGPFLNVLPQKVVAHPAFPVLFAIFVVIVVCLTIGLLTRLAFARRVGNWMEVHFLNAIPGYSTIRNLTRGLDDANGFKAAVLNAPDGSRQLVYLTEDRGDELATIMIPSVPNAMIGSIKIVPREHLQILNVKLTGIARVFTQRGVGAQELLSGKISN
jgi:uncharacterized membrane protein